MGERHLEWMSYDELLQQPEWIAHAQRIKQSSGRCEGCGETQARLDVHHHFYERGRLPWQYERTELAVLCRQCHRDIHGALGSFRRFVMPRLRPEHLKVLTGALLAGLRAHGAQHVVSAIAGLMSDQAATKRFALEWARETNRLAGEATEGK